MASESKTAAGIRYAPAQGDTMAEMRENVRNTELYMHGDCVLVWVNEGDLFGCVKPFPVKLSGPRP